MGRKWREADYEEMEKREVKIGEVLPAGHLVRFVAKMVRELDLSEIYDEYGESGGVAYEPELLLSLIIYGYITGIGGCRKIEEATKQDIAWMWLAGGYHPDHDTINNFRQKFMPQIEGLCVQLLERAMEMGIVKMENISGDGSKIHANASKSKAMSYKRVMERKKMLEKEVAELMALGEEEIPSGMNRADEIGIRNLKINRLCDAEQILKERAEERYEDDLAAYEERMAERAAEEAATGKGIRGAKPKKPSRKEPEEKAQYNFTDPESRIMPEGNHDGYEQSYNAQAAVDQESLLIVGSLLSDNPNDKRLAIPLLDAIPAEMGKPKNVAYDTGYWSEKNVVEIEARGIEPYIATGRESHHLSWQERFLSSPEPPAEDASAKVKMAYKLKTGEGKQIYRRRKFTVEPVFGIIKEVMRFRQFSLRGMVNAAGEWTLVCLAYNLKRLHQLLW